MNTIDFVLLLAVIIIATVFTILLCRWLNRFLNSFFSFIKKLIKFN